MQGDKVTRMQVQTHIRIQNRLTEHYIGQERSA